MSRLPFKKLGSVLKFEIALMLCAGGNLGYASLDQWLNENPSIYHYIINGGLSLGFLCYYGLNCSKPDLEDFVDSTRDLGYVDMTVSKKGEKILYASRNVLEMFDVSKSSDLNTLGIEYKHINEKNSFLEKLLSGRSDSFLERLFKEKPDSLKDYEITFLKPRVEGSNKPREEVHVIINSAEMLPFSSKARLTIQDVTSKSFDSMTGVYTRNKIFSEGRKAVESQSGYYYCFIDLDYFKEVNDKFGHNVGDKLLCDFTNRVDAAVKYENTTSFGRIGGDEFLLLLNSKIKIKQTLDRLLGLVSRPYIIDIGKSRRLEIDIVSASIGVSPPNDQLSFEEHLKEADMAVYQAKDAGRNCYVMQGEIGRYTPRIVVDNSNLTINK